MLCLSGFELYSRWVPLTNEHLFFNMIVTAQKDSLHNDS